MAQVGPADIYDPNKKEFSEKLKAFSRDFVFVVFPRLRIKSCDCACIVELPLELEGIKKRKLNLIIKSTIPIGTVDILCEKFEEKNIVHNPEFLTERTANEDF